MFVEGNFCPVAIGVGGLSCFLGSLGADLGWFHMNGDQRGSLFGDATLNLVEHGKVKT